MACGHAAGDQVSFVLGELVIRHGCNPSCRMRSRSVSPLTPFGLRVLHLVCESATPNSSLKRTNQSLRD
jgi:hypothetical protein